ncbi:MAG TPA: hypothetical protein VJ692_14720 [Nitrospiraceae bacterium]|nr:hypothetical protein [Nitrospiraceae bacterium]
MQWLPILVLLLITSPAFAGEIRGTVTEGGKSVGAGVAIDVRCGDKTYSTATDKYGSYRVFVPDKGTCALNVTYQNQTPSREIVSFEDSTRYDLVLEKQGAQYSLRRH